MIERWSCSLSIYRDGWQIVPMCTLGGGVVKFYSQIMISEVEADYEKKEFQLASLSVVQTQAILLFE